MIDIRLMGGLGNQMFQYALYKSFEHRGVPVKMFVLGAPEEAGRKSALEQAFPGVRFVRDEGAAEYERLDRQNVQRPLPVRAVSRLVLSWKKVIQEPEDGVYDPRIPALMDAALIGYWQTSRYWSEIADTVRDSFVFGREYDSELADFLKSAGDRESVAVHIRGGDYRTEENGKIFGGICTPEYYRNAMDRLREGKTRPVFYIFTNDKQYAQTLLGQSEDCVFVSDLLGSGYPDWVDLMLMSHCRHQILANSSFSWWGAYLNKNLEKTVIAPDRWMNGHATKDIWEKEWIRIGSR